MKLPGRLPIESSQPLVVFAVVRLLLSLLALGVVILLGFPYQGELAAVIGGVAVPWSVFNLVLARRAPARALNPLIAVGDMLMLAAIEAVAPETYGAVRFMALSFLAVHAHFQGERIGVPMAVLAVIVLAIPTALLNEGAVHDQLLVFYESVFAAAAIATVALVGRFRTAESASRLRARELSRRTIRAEHEIRRKVSESLHDGPVQELIGLDMTLAAARNEAARGGADSVAEMLDGAREMTERNVQALRDEMLDLGPYAYEEFSLEAALERCVPVWQRRYGLAAHLELERVDLPSETEGELFRIAQEAVVNAARHGAAAQRDDLAGGPRSDRGAHRSRRRLRLRRGRPPRRHRARPPGPGEHARAHGADGRRAQHRQLGAGNDRQSGGAADHSGAVARGSAERRHAHRDPVQERHPGQWLQILGRGAGEQVHVDAARRCWPAPSRRDGPSRGAAPRRRASSRR